MAILDYLTAAGISSTTCVQLLQIYYLLYSPNTYMDSWIQSCFVFGNGFLVHFFWNKTIYKSLPYPLAGFAILISENQFKWCPLVSRNYFDKITERPTWHCMSSLSKAVDSRKKAWNRTYLTTHLKQTQSVLTVSICIGCYWTILNFSNVLYLTQLG